MYALKCAGSPRLGFPHYAGGIPRSHKLTDGLAFDPLPQQKLPRFQIEQVLVVLRSDIFQSKELCTSGSEPIESCLVFLSPGKPLDPDQPPRFSAKQLRSPANPSHKSTPSKCDRVNPSVQSSQAIPKAAPTCPPTALLEPASVNACPLRLANQPPDHDRCASGT